MADMDAVKLKRFLLFAGDNYYPTGGWRDFYSAHDTLDDAVLEAANLQAIDWWHVIDSTSGEEVKFGIR